MLGSAHLLHQLIMFIVIYDDEFVSVLFIAKLLIQLCCVNGAIFPSQAARCAYLACMLNGVKYILENPIIAVLEAKHGRAVGANDAINESAQTEVSQPISI